ncbi:NAD(P)/FAD-dependent oxidoreductase [Microbacterium sp. CFH 31415]|uniref:flavin-containing monooxygenase n=1 Tax=Microbacterium sp. CFH 31415 TaxID=2921732 RepID=UPI001F12D25D|nr:NAD(P)/FAD-dependent oxidoreductase [Microbacterium sp. CFH 31415]MCH6231644.1 NAD(P)/FAD-dependent oxidoreductase [Microbacterium sp. CFH 31415]
MTHDADIIVVGAGLAGIYTSIHADRAGLSIIGFDAAGDVGGTWYWNRYPGARCDVESIDYSFSFDPELEQEWRWTERYAAQPEILAYLNHVADRYDVRRHFTFGRRVASADWDEATQRWTVRTHEGDEARARWVIMASGCLSAPHLPAIPGRDDFAGEVYMTAAWPHEKVDFTGKRVALIGTGSSGIQSLPLIADEAAEVVVYQRSANYSVPASNRTLSDEDWKHALSEYPERRRKSWNGLAGSPWGSNPTRYQDTPEEERDAIFEESWERGGVLFSKAFPGQMVDRETNEAARLFFERKLAEKVKDPQVLVDLTPTDHAIGTKRICTDTGYYETFNRENVTLVNLRREPILKITAEGVTTESGARRFDAIVYATGFDAMTGALTSIDIRGRDGRLLRDEWAGGPSTFLGFGIPGFPNLLSLNGPGCPSVLSNMALGSEQQGDFALRLIQHCDAQGYTSAEARADAAAAWTAHSQELAEATLFAEAPSWYMGANIEGKARTFLPYLGGFRPYIERCEEVVDAGYRGFVLSSR